jgi:uncharacterized membrane protein
MPVRLANYKLIFISVGLMGILLIASPEIVESFRIKNSEPLTELYILGPSHMMKDYPTTIVAGETYSINVNVVNHLGTAAYYVLYTNFKNQTGAVANSVTSLDSNTQLYETRFVLRDGQCWENQINFSLTDVVITGNQSFVRTLMVNNAVYNVDKPADWNPRTNTFTYQLSFELWLYNRQTGVFEFNNRYVNLDFNATCAN